MHVALTPNGSSNTATIAQAGSGNRAAFPLLTFPGKQVRNARIALMRLDPSLSDL